MKKKTLLNAIIVLLLIIMGVSCIVAGFIEGRAQGFSCICVLSFSLRYGILYAGGRTFDLISTRCSIA